MSSKPARILLIEDDPLHAQMIEAMVMAENENFETVIETALEPGLARLIQGDVDLVLLDLELPDSEGPDAFLRVQQQAPNLPIVVLTTAGDDDLALRTLQAGAQEFLIKWEMDHRLVQRTMHYALERKRAENERQEYERTIRRIADAMPEIVALIEPNLGKMLFINDQIKQTLGYSLPEAQSLTLATLVHPHDRQRLSAHFAQLLASHEDRALEIEYRVRHANGDWRWLDCRHIVYSRHPDGKPHQILCSAHDATKRKKAERALLKSEARYRDLVENSGLFIGTHDAEGRILSANQSILKFLGFARIQEITGRKLSDFLSGCDQSLFQDYLERILARGHDNGTTNLISPGGEKIILEYSNTLRQGAPGKRIVRCVGRDVTLQARTEAALLESEQRWRFALDAAGLGAWEWKIETDRVLEDELAQQLVGVVEGGLESFLMRVHPDDREAVRMKIEQSLATKENHNLEFRVTGPDGQTRWVETQSRMMCDPEGRPIRVVGVIRDMTEKKRHETEIYRSQRLESIGALASGIAHDLNNVLAPILMALHTLQQRFTDENSQRWLSLIHKSAERGRDLIEQMIAFAKGASGERTPLSLNRLVEDLANILRETLPKDVELAVNLPEDLWGITGDATQIHQVLMNLCLNARDAMPEGGRLTITANNIDLNQDEARMHPDVRPGRFVRLTVADTGVGISSQIIDRIFDPFFTTKEKGKGSGLGLSTVLGIVRGHGGFVDAQSVVAHGARFHVYLSAREIIFPGATEPQPQEPLNGHGELILVIDDEPDICEVAKDTLESCGYRVLAARDGQEAIEIYRQYQHEIQVVLTDMMMPNLDGPATIRALKEIDPQVRIIATSGIRSTGKLAEAAASGVDIFLAKPYTTDKLLGALAGIINNQRKD
jgi:PAS domain S-box-containing protein